MKNLLRELGISSGFDRLLENLSYKEVPRHRFSFAYLFGGITLFFMALQFLSGLLLLFYYSPTPATAYESVVSIDRNVWGGWVVRSIHHWSSDLLVLALLMHFGSTFFLRAYRKPREMTWISGVVLMFIVFGFCFTGSLLPWDVRAYFATQIGTEIPRTIPLVGPLLASILRGSATIGAESLTRLFALHVAVLPLTAMILILYHFMLNLRHGSSLPPGMVAGSSTKFYPDYLLREVIAWTLCAIVLAWFAGMAPAGLGAKADPYAPAPVGIRPEWYFWPMFVTLKWAPERLFGVSGELIINVAVALLGSAFLVVPWIDGQRDPERWHKGAMAAGALIMGYMVLTVVFTLVTG
jgi:cytochrome b6